MADVFYTDIEFSDHAWSRISARRIRKDAIVAAMSYGRRYWNEGRIVYRLDRRSVKKAAKMGLKLQRYEGIHVVLGDDGRVVTAYRNRNGKRVPR